MSNPISNVTSIPTATESAEKGPELEIDGPVDASAPAPPLEADAESASSTAEASADSVSSTDTDPNTDAAPKKGRGGMGLLALVLGLLLAGSVAFNLKQSRDLATLSNTNEQFEMALTAAVDRIDVETVRAESAEATLGGIDTAVDTVNARVTALIEALTALKEATAR